MDYLKLAQPLHRKHHQNQRQDQKTEHEPGAHPGLRCRRPLSEGHLRTAVTEYVVHYHTERNHQGIDNELITPLPASAKDVGPIVLRERLGGILNYYCRAA